MTMMRMKLTNWKTLKRWTRKITTRTWMREATRTKMS